MNGRPYLELGTEQPRYKHDACVTAGHPFASKGIIMLGRIFPRQFDNTFRGHWLAIWILVPVVLLELIIGANSIINTRSVAMGADGIPLDSFSAEAATTAISLFALLGFSRLLLALLGVMALIRYRAMIPFIYLLLIVLQLGSKALLLLHPAIRSMGHNSAAGSTVILVLIGMLLTGFVLSLLGKPKSEDR